MKITEINEPIVFIALKRISNYLINSVWNISLGTGEIEAEFELAKQRSKKYFVDIEKLSKLDADLDWGHKKTKKGDNYFSISKTGDYNPWYSGDLLLEDLLFSLESVVEFIESGDCHIHDSEFIHYYKYLRDFTGINEKIEPDRNVTVNIEKLKTFICREERKLCF